MILYNILQASILLLFWPLAVLYVLLIPKYRQRIPARLGLKLDRPATDEHGRQTIWLHALSVGEVTSAVPLVKGLRAALPDSRIIVTVATKTGEAVAERLLGHLADQILASPLDLYPVVKRFIRYIKPDIYILVETDFWPNLLQQLNAQKIPAILVNGRISAGSLKTYRKFALFFTPMFACFNHLCMQTAVDRDNITEFGISPEKVHTLGNLKFDNAITMSDDPSEIYSLLPQERWIMVAGSTHAGEEEVLLGAYQKVRKKHPQLFLVLVPRNPERASDIQKLIHNHAMRAELRSQQPQEIADILLVDTIGELVECYRYARLAFVGGGLVAKGGHNPIEPASFDVPVLFGPNMTDFQEIADDLIQAGGALTVADISTLSSAIERTLTDESLRQSMGVAAGDCVRERQGVIQRHIELILPLL